MKSSQGIEEGGKQLVLKSLFKLPESSATPLVFFAHGTSIAPIMSLLIKLDTQKHTGPITLFFGIREASADFLFQS